MKNNKHEQEVEHKDNGANAGSAVVAGLVIGGLAGAGAALLFAPQSGKETREQIQQKTVELRDQAAEKVEVAVSQVKDTAQKVTANLHGKTEELKQQGGALMDSAVSQVKDTAQKVTANLQGKAEDLRKQGEEIIVDQLDHVSAAAEAGKAALTHEPERTNGKHHS